MKHRTAGDTHERMKITRALLGFTSMIALSASASADDAMTMTHVSGASSDVVVQAQNADGSWSTVCSGSCDRPLPSDGVYRIDGPGLRTSKPFAIEGPQTWLTVNTGSWAGFAGGLTLTILGLPAAGFGALGLLIDGLIHLACSYNCSADVLLLPSALLTVGGTAAAITGVALIMGNRRTSVSGAATVRLPAWRETPSVASPHLGAIGIPVISGTF